MYLSFKRNKYTLQDVKLDGFDFERSVTCSVTHQRPGQKLRFSFPLLLLLIELYLNVYFEDWTYNLNIIIM